MDSKTTQENKEPTVTFIKQPNTQPLTKDFIQINTPASQVPISQQPEEKEVLFKKRFQCNVCYRSYSTKWNLKQHQRVHDESKAFKCTECSKVFSNKILLKSHMLIHTGEKPFECRGCGKRFNKKGNLKKHELVHTEERKFKCALCPHDKWFKDKDQLQKHMKYHQKPTFECATCKQMFHTRALLNQHAKLHDENNKHKCNQCGKMFTCNSILRVHMLTHSEERPFKCNFCKKGFKSKNQLLMHEYTHVGKPGFKCSECPDASSFPAKPGTEVLLSKHLDKKFQVNYQCFKCGHKFYEVVRNQAENNKKVTIVE